MEFEFDKEIDSLLRQAARDGGTAFGGNNPPPAAVRRPQPSHLDADEISLFAENALPAKARARATEHLADCDRCRKILSGLISLNSETESENVHAKEIVAGSVSVPWYQKLFMFPQMAYAMGALALVFSGIIVLLVLQNSRESRNASVAQIEEMQGKPQGAKGMSSDGDDDTAPAETYSAATNTTTANTTSNSTTTTANTSSINQLNRPSAVVPGTLTNSNSSISLNEKPVSEEKVLKDALSAPAPAAAPRDKAPELAKKEDFVRDGPTPSRKDSEPRNEDETLKAAKSQTENVQNLPLQNQARIAPDTQSVRSGTPNRAQDRKGLETRELDAAGAVAGGESKNKTAAARKASTARTAGGKTFSYANGVWYDSAYSNQKTTNVRRGTDEYKKLDSGLRSIAENIGGVVVVVWNGKAYRIQ